MKKRAFSITLSNKNLTKVSLGGIENRVKHVSSRTNHNIEDMSVFHKGYFHALVNAE